MMFEIDYVSHGDLMELLNEVPAPPADPETNFQGLLDLLGAPSSGWSDIDDLIFNPANDSAFGGKESGMLFGAGDGGEIVIDGVDVVGEPDPDDPFAWHPGDPLPNPDGSGAPPDSGGGDDGGSGAPPSDRPFSGCEDRRADTLADEINTLIQQMPDVARTEYGALIWRDSGGTLHYSSITPGTNGEWNPPTSPSAGGFNSWSQVVGFIHSHPTQVFLNGQWISVPAESHFEQPS